MIRGASISILVLGTAWLLAGLGAVVSNSESGKSYEAEVAEANKMAADAGDEMIAEAKKAHDEIAQDELERIEGLQARLDDKQAKFDEASKRFDEPIAEKLAAKEEAEADGNARLMQKLDKQITRLESRRDSALRRPAAARDAAAEKVKAAKEARAEALAEAKAAIAQAQKSKTEQIASTKKDLESLKPETGVAGPSIATLLGLGLLAFGAISLAKTPVPVRKTVARVRPPSVPPAVPEPTIDAPPAIASEEVIQTAEIDRSSRPNAAKARSKDSAKDHPTISDVPKDDVAGPPLDLAHTGDATPESPLLPRNGSGEARRDAFSD